jgi:hypothetical protein
MKQVERYEVCKADRTHHTYCDSMSDAQDDAMALDHMGLGHLIFVHFTDSTFVTFNFNDPQGVTA